MEKWCKYKYIHISGKRIRIYTECTYKKARNFCKNIFFFTESLNNAYLLLQGYRRRLTGTDIDYSAYAW